MSRNAVIHGNKGPAHGKRNAQAQELQRVTSQKTMPTKAIDAKRSSRNTQAGSSGLVGKFHNADCVEVILYG